MLKGLLHMIYQSYCIEYKLNMEKVFVSLIILINMILMSSTICNAQMASNTTFEVGVVLDIDSPVGRIATTSLSLALTDFYSINKNYSTRIALNIRDSKRLITEAAAAALNLLRDVKVDAIIGPQRSSQASFVIGLGDAAKVPMLSFSAFNPSLHPKSPYFIQTGMSDSAQVHAIAAIVSHFQWNQVVLIYEDSNYGTGILPYLSNALQDANNARISYRSLIPLSSSDDFMLQELYKMKTMQTRVFLVHASTSLASKLFLKARDVEMMSEGYVWIATCGLMDLFRLLDDQVVEAMKGVLGVKPLIPNSSRLDNIANRWKKKHLEKYPNVSNAEIGLYGIWAYDTLWALATAVEKVKFREPSLPRNNGVVNSLANLFSTGISQTGPNILKSISYNDFEALSGEFHLVNGQLMPSAFQILNIVGKEERVVGIWTESDQRSSRQTKTNVSGFREDNLRSIIWPGESSSVPKGWEVPVSGKRLKIGVPVKASFDVFVKVDKDPKTNAYRFSGYCIDVFDSVMKQLPYAVRYDYFPFPEDGGSNNGGYNELIKRVAAGEFDGAVGDITVTSSRTEYVDFTLPFAPGGITMISRIEYENPNNKWIFLKPFTLDLWLTALGLLLLIGGGVWLLEHRVNNHFRGSPTDNAGMIFYFPFMSLFYAQRERVVSNFSRLVVVVWMLVVLALNSTFTASLSARITVQKLRSSVGDVEQLKVNNASVGCRQASFVCGFLVNDLNFSSSQIKKYESPNDVEKSLDNKTIKAFFSGMSYTKFFLSEPRRCEKYMTGGRIYPTEGFAFVFPKGSPLVAEVSRAVIKVTESGRNSLVEEKWTTNEDCDRQVPSNGETKISLKSFGILFGITAIIIIICLIISIAMYLYENQEFFRRIWCTHESVWSKVGAICKHFDQRDPKSFRSDDQTKDQDIQNVTPCT